MKNLKNYNIAQNEAHPFHLVNPSPWPLMTSLSIFGVLVYLVHDFHDLTPNTWVASFLRYYCIFAFVTTLILWTTDISEEGVLEGQHTLKVEQGFRYGVILFIASEIMFFVSLFWAYFHYSLNPSIWIGCVWPPQGIQPISPWGLPLLNTVVLLSSGVSVVWAHRALIAGIRNDVTMGFLITLGYGIFFTGLQTFEYIHAPFSINDSVYGSIFYMITGTHGVHVIVGTILLMIQFIRHLNYQLYQDRHFGFEAAAWYWHFVDVVWILVFLVIYWWGS